MQIFRLEGSKKQQYEVKIYDNSSICDQTEHDPGVDQEW